VTEANCLVDWNTEKLLKKFLSCDKALFYSLTVRYSQWSHYKTVSYVICKLSGTFCTLQVHRMSYSHWLNVMSGTCRHCYCSYGSAQNMKHYSWVGLLLGYYSTAWPLSPNYRKDNNVVRPNGWHFIANIETTELRPDHRSVAMWIISMLYRKKPDTVSLPHCQFQCSWYLEDCWKGYQVTIQQETLLL